METDECNGTTTGTKENGFHLYPVAQSQSGVGLPYAPEDFPNPGDKWIWKVGKRIAVSGYFYDRYLYLPTRFQKEHKFGGFASKLTVKQFVRKAFPSTNVDAFFASFSWKVPSIKIKDDTEMLTPVTGNSVNDSQAATDCCKAGNSTCSSLLLETEKPPTSNVTPCDFCCSEPDFCRHCCCIICCTSVHEASGGYDYIRCDSMVGEGFVCGHGVHIGCGLRSYMAGAVGGSINLDAEYYCRRCDTKTDLVPHVMNIFRRCKFIDLQDDIEKVLNICVSALRGSSRLNAQRLMHHIGSAAAKLKNEISREDVWKMEDLSDITTDLTPKQEKRMEDEILDPQEHMKLKMRISKSSARTKRRGDAAARQAVLSTKEAGALPLKPDGGVEEAAEEGRARHDANVGDAHGAGDLPPEAREAIIQADLADAEVEHQVAGRKRTRAEEETILEELVPKKAAGPSSEALARYVMTYDKVEQIVDDFCKSPTLKGLDVLARKGPKLRLGRLVLHRAMDEDLLDRLLESKPSREHLANRKGLLLCELATVSCYEDIRSKAADKLEQKLKKQAEKDKAGLAKAVKLLKSSRKRSLSKKEPKAQAEQHEKEAKDELVKAQDVVKAGQEEVEVLSAKNENLKKRAEEAGARLKQLEESIPSMEVDAIVRYKANSDFKKALADKITTM